MSLRVTNTSSRLGAYRICQTLALGVGGELCRLASGGCWDSRENVLDGDRRGGHGDIRLQPFRRVKLASK
jgi:hypothetical protein